MFNPFVNNLSELTDTDLDTKIKELSKKYLQAQRLGNNQVLTQLQTFITLYRDEQTQRYIKNKSSDNPDLNDLINIE